VLSASVRGSPGRRRLALRVGLPVAVAVMLLICYWLTLAPTITDPDSGELATAVHTMGVAHPTGYPLYLIVGKLFDLLPLGEPARRIAFFSAVSAAAGGGLLCWMLIALTGSGAAGVLGGLVLGLNWWVWPQANQVEVYALHVLLVCLVLAMFVRWLEQRTPRRLNQLAFCCGLALTHHRTSAFFIMPVLLWALVATRPVRVLGLARTVGWGLLPLLLYGWLPYRSAHHPPIDWGNTSAGLRSFLEHVIGSYYAGYAFLDTAANAWAHTQSSLIKLHQQLSLVGLALALVGMAGMVRSPRHRPLGISLAASFVAIVIWASFYGVPDKDIFYLPALIVISAWCGWGLAHGASAIARRGLRANAARAVSVVAWAAAAGLPASLVVRNWEAVDRSREYVSFDTAAVALRGVPSDAVLVLQADAPNASYLYHYYALDHGPAPVLISTGLAVMPWYQARLEPAIREVAVRSKKVPVHERPAWLARTIRARLDPQRPLYTSVEVEAAPPGYVLLKDPPLSRMVLAPGIAQAADAPGSRPLLELPDGAGVLLEVAVPREVERRKPFPVAAAIRWSGTTQSEGMLTVAFARRDIVETPVADPEIARQRLVMRSAPLLFGLAAPANRPRYHYRQEFSAILPDYLVPGRYYVLARVALAGTETPVVEAGMMTVR